MISDKAEVETDRSKPLDLFGIEPARLVGSALHHHPIAKLAILQPALRNIAVPGLAAEFLKRGKHRIPLLAKRLPGKTDRVEPSNAVGNQSPLLAQCPLRMHPNAQRSVVFRKCRDAAMAMHLLEVGQLGIHFIPTRIAAAVPFKTDRVEPPDTFAIYVAALLGGTQPLDPLGKHRILRPTVRHIAIAMKPTVFGQGSEHRFPSRLLRFPNDAQFFQLLCALRGEPARTLAAANSI